MTLRFAVLSQAN